MNAGSLAAGSFTCGGVRSASESSKVEEGAAKFYYFPPPRTATRHQHQQVRAARNVGRQSGLPFRPVYFAQVRLLASQPLASCLYKRAPSGRRRRRRCFRLRLLGEKSNDAGFGARALARSRNLLKP